AYVQNSTPSIQPVVDAIETRTYGNSTTYYPMPYLSSKNILCYNSAYTMDNFKIIDLVSVVQEHIDQGISTVLFVTNMASTRDIVKLYLYAHKKNLKSLYYTRTKNLSIEECLLCSV
ncbi:MAG: ribonucleotide-diphosphate reductase subunit alpha, partial [Firmicutes bacterium]|nr:ribonucleotide-diphosphate reductase subunit alpha [Bacillota bacterium]